MCPRVLRNHHLHSHHNVLEITLHPSGWCRSFWGQPMRPFTCSHPEFRDGRHLTLCGIRKCQSLGVMTSDDLETVETLAKSWSHDWLQAQVAEFMGSRHQWFPAANVTCRWQKVPGSINKVPQSIILNLLVRSCFERVSSHATIIASVQFEELLLKHLLLKLEYKKNKNIGKQSWKPFTNSQDLLRWRDRNKTIFVNPFCLHYLLLARPF